MKLHNPLTVLAALCAACSLPSVEVSGRYGTMEVSGSVGVTTGATVFQADLNTAGLTEDDSVPGAVVDLDFGAMRLWVSAFQSEYAGDGTLTATWMGDLGTITAGSPVRSALDLNVYPALLTFDLFPGDMIELGIGLGVTGLDFAVRVEDLSGTGTVIEGEQMLPIPVLAARVGVWLGPVEVAAVGSGITGKYDGNELTYYDIDAYGRLKLFGGKQRLRLSILGGYRHLFLDVDFTDDTETVQGEFTFNGPYAGVQLSF